MAHKMDMDDGVDVRLACDVYGDGRQVWTASAYYDGSPEYDAEGPDATYAALALAEVLLEALQAAKSAPREGTPE